MLLLTANALTLVFIWQSGLKEKKFLHWKVLQDRMENYLIFSRHLSMKQLCSVDSVHQDVL